jgi:hypothetical protein
VKRRHDKHGTVLHTGSGHPITHGLPIDAWDAWVIGVNADGTVDLEIAHPFGQSVRGQRRALQMHAKPDRGAHPDAPGIKHDAGKGLHTWHFEGE